MGEVIVITSGKGGVGKNNNYSKSRLCISTKRQKVALVDTDIGLRKP